MPQFSLYFNREAGDVFGMSGFTSKSPGHTRNKPISHNEVETRLGHCIVTWYAMSRSGVMLTDMRIYGSYHDVGGGLVE